MEEERQTTTRTTATAPAGERVVATEETVSQASSSSAVLAKRVVYYIAGVIIALIGLRFLFLLLGANQGSGFVDFIYGLSGLFVAPFTGIFGEPTFGVSYVETSSIVAMIVYALLAVGIGKLLTLNRPVK